MLLPLLIKIRLATMAMAGWTAAASPVPMPAEAFALVFETRAATPVEVKLWDENLRVGATLLLDHDGNSDEATTQKIRHIFRCRDTNRERAISRKTLAMLADVAERYDGKTIEFVSAYRVRRGEGKDSPHRAGRAIDFRIRGENLMELRDYLWRKYTHVGIGWYPSEKYIHMDSRPKDFDTAWTFVRGKNRYHPHWSEVARRPASEQRPKPDRRPGA
jgi:uncharacterized protein YcbK (DUF882 family)